MLLIKAPHDPHGIYGGYLAEILLMEGFADVQEVDLPAVDEAALARHDVVLLPRLTTTSAQAELLAGYVARGGRLVAFLPDDTLVRKMGLRPAFTVLDGGYLHLDAAHPLLAGLCAEPAQVVVPAVAWTPERMDRPSVTILAELRGSPDHAPAWEAIPGVVHVGLAQGEAILFAYDLPHAIARLRQGDPAHADLATAGLDGIYRATDLFVAQLDPRRALVPQADLQTALLGRLIESLAPRPRLWYYPAAGERSVVVMTSDDDWSTPEQFEMLLEGLRRRDARCTFYMVPGTHITDAQMARWARDGHAFSVHPALESDYGLARTQPAEPHRAYMEPMLRDNVARHQQEHGRPVRTIRQHCVRWLGYVDAARVLADLGVGLDTNYFAAPPFNFGYLSGSGRPLRFVDADGTVIGCFQQPTLWSEECLIHPTFLISLKWSVERALAETTAILRRAAHEFYTPVTFNSHPVSFATYSRPLVEGQWDAARAEGLRIISADDWLDWTEARAALRLAAGGDGWTLQSPRSAPSVTLLFPAGSAPRAEAAEATTQVLWGRPYTALTLRDLRAGEERRIAWSPAAVRERGAH